MLSETRLQFWYTQQGEVKLVPTTSIEVQERMGGALWAYSTLAYLVCFANSYTSLLKPTSKIIIVERIDELPKMDAHGQLKCNQVTLYDCEIEDVDGSVEVIFGSRPRKSKLDVLLKRHWDVYRK